MLRLAVPPRHATAEKALAIEPPDARDPARATAAQAWRPYAAGPAFLSHLTSGGSPTASWLTVPSGAPVTATGRRARRGGAATVAGGRGAVLVVPDHRDVARVEAALRDVLGPGRHIRLTADQGPQARYTAWLKVLRGHAQVVVGTRAAAFAPVRELGLVAWWDDGDDLLDEPRAPYPHVRDVLLARAGVRGRRSALGRVHPHRGGAADLVAAGPARVEAAPEAQLRRAVPRCGWQVRATTSTRDPAVAAAHLPSVAWRTAKAALERGPVLVQVPRRGYLPIAVLPDCRRPARCRCAGTARPAGAPGAAGLPVVREGRTAFACPACGGHRLRSSVVGARRTAEELGRAFPGVAGRAIRGRHRARHGRRRTTPGRATPGAEPVAAGGYAAALLLDALGPARPPDPGRRGRRRCVAGSRPRRWSPGIARVGGSCLRCPDRHDGARRRGPGALGPGLVRRPRAGRAS